MQQFLFSLHGRISRKAIWFFLIAIVVLKIVVFMIDFGMGFRVGIGLPMASVVFSLVTLWPSVAVGMKRFHDRNLTGKWMIFFLGMIFMFNIVGAAINQYSVPEDADPQRSTTGGLVSFTGVFAVWITLFVLLFVNPGTPGENKYGPDPLEKN